MTSLTQGGDDAARREAPRRRALEELLRPRPRVVDVHAADRADARVDRRAVRQERAGASTPTRAAFKAGYNFGETTELFDHPYEVKPGQAAARRVHEHHRQHRAGVGPRRRRPAGQAAGVPRLATRSRRPPTSSTSCRSTRTSASARCRPRTRSPPSASALGAAFAGHLGVTTTSGPGVALKSETISLAVSLELPLLDHRHPARRPVDRPADQDRGRRPATWRCTAATARRRCRSSPAYSPAHCFYAAIEAARIALKYRTPVILLSDGYLANGAEPWRLPDVDDAARHLGAVRHRAEPRRRRRQPRCSGRTCATPRRSLARGRSPARPG